jgi:hypothetical protein
MDKMNLAIWVAFSAMNLRFSLPNCIHTDDTVTDTQDQG